MQDPENYELDPNFAIVCSFLERFGKHIGESFVDLSIDEFKSFLEATQVNLKSIFVKLHVVLNRGIGNKHRPDEWLKGVIKFCRDFPDGDDKLINENGYENIPVSVKLRILKNLCEDQFEYNDRFNRRVNAELDEGTNIRHEPLGKDKLGRSYWLMQDKEGGMGLFRGWYNGLTKDETWNKVCSEADELESLIETLEEAEELKQEDPVLPKSGEVSTQKKVSPKKLVTTATEDAAYGVYFSSNMSSPRFFKAPKRRSKVEILKDEKHYDLPHCDVALTRLPQEELDKYVKKGGGTKSVKKNTSNELLKGTTETASLKEASTAKSVSRSNKKESENSKVEDDLHIDLKQTNENGETVKSNDKIKSCDTVNSNFDKGKMSENEPNNENLHVNNENTKTVQKNYKERHKSQSDSEHEDIEKDTRNDKELASNEAAGKMDFCESNNKCDVSDQHTLADVKENTCNSKEELSGDCNVRKRNTKETKGKGRTRSEKVVSEKEKENDVSLIDGRGDATSKSEKKNETKTCIRPEMSIENHSVKIPGHGDKKNLSSVDTKSRNEKEVFDNAIQDLIQLEGKSLGQSQFRGGETAEIDTACSELAAEDCNPNIPKTKDLSEEKLTKEVSNGVSGVDSDLSLDSDKQVIDNALKDLIQLEEMISQGSPASICMSPPNSSDFSTSEVQENRKLKGHSLKESCSETGISLDDKIEAFKLTQVEKLPSDIGRKKSEVVEHDIACEGNFSDSEADKKSSQTTNDVEIPNSDKKDIIDTNKPELTCSIKETCNRKGELPVNEFIAKIINVIESKGDIKTEKTGTNGLFESNQTTKCEEKDPGLTKHLKTENVRHTETVPKVEPKFEVLKVERKAKHENKSVEKKPLSMMVGDEIIHIEEASDDSDDDTKTTEVENESQTDTTSEIDTVKCVGTSEKCVKELKDGACAKIQEIIENNSKLVNQTENKRKGKKGKLQPTFSKTDSKEEKEMMKSLYVSNVSAENPVMPNVIYLPTKNDSEVSKKPQIVRNTLPVSVVNTQNKSGSVADLLRTVYVPLTVPGNMPYVVNKTMLVRPQVPTQNSMLVSPAMSTGAGSFSLLTNHPNVRPAAMPVIMPRITFASGHAPVLNKGQSLLRDSSTCVKIKPMQNTVIPNQKSEVVLKSLLGTKPKNSLVSNMIKERIKSNAAPSVAKKEEGNNGSMKKMVIVVGEEGLRLPADKRLIIAGPKGKFYDKVTGYEVDFPFAENLNHVPGKVYLASNVSFTKDIRRKLMSGKGREKKVKSSKGSCTKGSKKNRADEDSTTTDEEFEKMLESEMIDEPSEHGEESDDPNYDYERISQRVRAARAKKLPAQRVSIETTDSEEEERQYRYEETVPLVLGRNAKRAAARKRINYKEPGALVIVLESSDEDEAATEVTEADPCKVCNKGNNPSSILLCDKCDGSYHMSCLSPPLSLVPFEDWFCPQCEHKMLIECLKEKLTVVQILVKKAKRRFSRRKDSISQKTFSIDAENIVVGERRSSRSKKEVSYSDRNYDQMIKKAVKEINNPKKHAKSFGDADSESDSSSKHRPSWDQNTQRKSHKKRDAQRQRNGTSESGDDRKKSSAKKRKPTSLKNEDDDSESDYTDEKESLAKKRRLTCLEDESGDSGSEYVESDGSDSTEDGPADADQEDMAMGGLYFTSSGRQTKHVSYNMNI